LWRSTSTVKVAFSSQYLCHFGSIDFGLYGICHTMASVRSAESDSRDSTGKATARGRLNLPPGGRD
jgi:hypothetical protein